MCISKCASALRKNTTSASCDATVSASGVFALVDGRKNTTSACCTVSRLSWAQVYWSGMQQPHAACTRAPPQYKSCMPLCYLDLVQLHLDVGNGSCALQGWPSSADMRRLHIGACVCFSSTSSAALFNALHRSFHLSFPKPMSAGSRLRTAYSKFLLRACWVDFSAAVVGREMSACTCSRSGAFFFLNLMAQMNCIRP